MLQGDLHTNDSRKTVLKARCVRNANSDNIVVKDRFVDMRDREVLMLNNTTRVYSDRH